MHSVVPDLELKLHWEDDNQPLISPELPLLCTQSLTLGSKGVGKEMLNMYHRSSKYLFFAHNAQFNLIGNTSYYMTSNVLKKGSFVVAEAAKT